MFPHKKFVEANPQTDPVPAWATLVLFATKKEAINAAKEIGWASCNAVKAKGRFQVLWGIYDSGQGYLTQDYYRYLLADRNKTQA